MPEGQEDEFFHSRSVVGTEKIVRAAVAEGVQRIVFTSSYAAVGFGHAPDPAATPPGPDDATWTNLDGLRQAWDGRLRRSVPS